MYSEPEWSQATGKSGFLEVLKNGNIFESVPIPSGTRFFTFGLLPDNDVPLDHESISRKHAVLQFGPRNTAFIFDLGSTHGTFLNKKQIPSSQFIKITSENDMFQFGASSRFYILNLKEEESGEPSTASAVANVKNYRALVMKFFASNDISTKSITFFQKGNISSCHFDFSDCICISTDSSESSNLTSSGATKSEAFENFYEDSFNFLTRLGLIENENYDEESESDVSDQENSNRDLKRNENLKDALSEEQIVSLRDQFKIESETIHNEIDSMKNKLNILEHELVEDFDVYIQDLKKAELKQDIEKKQENLDYKKIELVKYEKILNLIGFKDDATKTISAETEIANEQTLTSEKKSKVSSVHESKNTKKLESISVRSEAENLIKSTEADEKEFENITEFEDSTLHEEKVDLVKLKRKYGY